MTGVHPSAVLANDVSVAADVTIGPFCVLGVYADAPPLRIGAGAMIRSHSVIYRGCLIGDRFHSGHGVLIREESRIGDDVSIGSHSVVEHHVEIAGRVRLHSQCFVPELSVLEEGAWLGPGVTVTNARYPNRPDTKAKLEGVRIGRDAVIGARAILLPGVSIGHRAVVGAGAVVVEDVAAGTTVVGNPARVSRE